MGRTASLLSMLLPKPGVSITRTRRSVLAFSSKRSKQRETSTCFVDSPVLFDPLGGAGRPWVHESKSMLQVVVFPRPERPATIMFSETTRGFSRSDACADPTCSTTAGSTLGGSTMGGSTAGSTTSVTAAGSKISGSTATGSKAADSTAGSTASGSKASGSTALSLASSSRLVAPNMRASMLLFDCSSMARAVGAAASESAVAIPKARLAQRSRIPVTNRRSAEEC
mmetsp:Transcript_30318/g.102291  ORF Transcript_30318/g.102291 Transcript_30318/m.102291 type:complete len:226 (+) Transcript_30318:975-1652(+)